MQVPPGSLATGTIKDMMCRGSKIEAPRANALIQQQNANGKLKETISEIILVGKKRIFPGHLRPL